MQDQIFWTANLEAFSPFQRVSSLVISSLLLGVLLFGAFASGGGVA